MKALAQTFLFCCCPLGTRSFNAFWKATRDGKKIDTYFSNGDDAIYAEVVGHIGIRYAQSQICFYAPSKERIQIVKECKI